MKDLSLIEAQLLKSGLSVLVEKFSDEVEIFLPHIDEMRKDLNTIIEKHNNKPHWTEYLND